MNVTQVTENESRPDNWPKLPGMRPIREHLGIDISALPGHRQNLYRVDRCAHGVSYGTLCAIAQALSCANDDLLSVPTPQRLAQIKVAYHEHQAELARAEAGLTAGERAAS